MKIMAGVGMKLVDGGEYGETLIPPSGSLEVLMKLMKASQYLSRMNKEDTILARQELEEAIALDPGYAALYSLLAMTHFMDLNFQSSESPEISFAQASKNIKKALALDNEDYVAHFVLTHLYWLRKERDKAIAALERAIAINPNGADAYALLGNWFTFTGKFEEGIKLIEKAIRLNPIPPAQYLVYLGGAYGRSGRYRDAIEVLKQVFEHSPNNLFAHIGLTHAYSASGREKEARHQAQELLRLDPAFSLGKYAEILLIYFEDKAEAERYIADLRKAGLK
jgi:Tfp pilus assembly protein PilF